LVSFNSLKLKESAILGALIENIFVIQLFFLNKAWKEGWKSLIKTFIGCYIFVLLLNKKDFYLELYPVEREI